MVTTEEQATAERRREHEALSIALGAATDFYNEIIAAKDAEIAALKTEVERLADLAKSRLARVGGQESDRAG